METNLNELKTFISGLPKAELHVHLGGTVSPQMEFKLARRNHVNLGIQSPAELQHNYQPSLKNFLRACHVGMQVIETGKDLYDITWDFLKHLAKQNVKHVEISLNPQDYTHRGISFDDVFQNVHQALLNGQKLLGINSALILSLVRSCSESIAFKTLEEARPYHQLGWIAGIGLDDDEYRNPPIKFRRVFKQARIEGYHLAVHADVDQVNSVEHIAQAIGDINVDRIGHGVNIVNDAGLMNLAIQKQTGFTVCPISNQYCAGDMKVNAIKTLLKHGALVSINSDDPAYMGNHYINDNYLQIAQKAGLYLDQLVQIAKNSFLTAWIPAYAKHWYLKQIDKYVNNFRSSSINRAVPSELIL